MDDTALTIAQVSLRRRNRLHAGAAILLSAAAPPVLLALATVANLLPLAALAPLSLLGGLLLWTANPAPPEQLGQLAAGPLGLFFEGRRLSSRADIRGGRLLTSPGDAPVVRLATSRGALEIRVTDALAGEALLLALGVGSPRPREVRLASAVYADPTVFAQVTLIATLFPLLCGAVGFALHSHPLLCAALGVATAAAALFVLVTLTAPTRLALDEGGLTVTWLGRRRFFPAGELEGARLWDESQGLFGRGLRRGISIFLRSGEALRFALAGDEGDVTSLLDRLREATTRPAALTVYREVAPALDVAREAQD